MPSSWLRHLVVVALAGLGVASLTVPAAADDAEPAPAPAPAPPPPPAPSCVPHDRCCRVCDAGQACGNSCISRAKVCHKGRGCSCNAAEVCH